MTNLEGVKSILENEELQRRIIGAVLEWEDVERSESEIMKTAIASMAITDAIFNVMKSQNIHRVPMTITLLSIIKSLYVEEAEIKKELQATQQRLKEEGLDQHPLLQKVLGSLSIEEIEKKVSEIDAKNPLTEMFNSKLERWM